MPRKKCTLHGVGGIPNLKEREPPPDPMAREVSGEEPMAREVSGEEPMCDTMNRLSLTNPAIFESVRESMALVMKAQTVQQLLEEIERLREKNAHQEQQLGGVGDLYPWMREYPFLMLSDANNTDFYDCESVSAADKKMASRWLAQNTNKYAKCTGSDGEEFLTVNLETTVSTADEKPVVFTFHFISAMFDGKMKLKLIRASFDKKDSAPKMVFFAKECAEDAEYYPISYNVLDYHGSATIFMFNDFDDKVYFGHGDKLHFHERVEGELKFLKFYAVVQGGGTPDTFTRFMAV